MSVGRPDPMVFEGWDFGWNFGGAESTAFSDIWPLEWTTHDFIALAIVGLSILAYTIRF